MARTDPKYVIQFFTACSKESLDNKIKLLVECGWREQRLNDLINVWEQFVAFEKSGTPIQVDENALYDAIFYDVVKRYSSRWWFSAFAGQCKTLSLPFKPYPSPAPLYSSDGALHYLWLSAEIREALLQLWIYCDQDRGLFDAAVAKVWDEYRGYSKFDEGYAGQADRFAQRLKDAADSMSCR